MKITEVKSVPSYTFRRGTRVGPLRRKMFEMKVGQMIQVEDEKISLRSLQKSVYDHSEATGTMFQSSIGMGVLYVKRIG
jgi:hypothetical protein